MVASENCFGICTAGRQAILNQPEKRPRNQSFLVYKDLPSSVDKGFKINLNISANFRYGLHKVYY